MQVPFVVLYLDTIFNLVLWQLTSKCYSEFSIFWGLMQISWWMRLITPSQSCEKCASPSDNRKCVFSAQCYRINIFFSGNRNVHISLAIPFSGFPSLFTLIQKLPRLWNSYFIPKTELKLKFVLRIKNWNISRIDFNNYYGRTIGYGCLHFRILFSFEI